MDYVHSGKKESLLDQKKINFNLELGYFSSEKYFGTFL